MTRLTGFVMGSLLALGGCMDDGTRDLARKGGATTDGPSKPNDRTDSKKSTQECSGNAVDVATIAGDLAIDAASGDLIVDVRNDGDEPQTIEVVVHTRDPRGALVTTDPLGITLMPGQSGGVHVAAGDLNGDGIPVHVKAELVVRGIDGGIVERAFVHGDFGPTLEDAATNLRIPVVETIDGEIATLAAIVPGGPGLDWDSFDSNDTPDEVYPPPIPPSTPMTYNMCFRWPVTLVDAGFGEDYGTNPASPWIARGGRVSIVQDGQQLFNGWLDDIGCTGPFQALRTTDFSIFGYSRARVAGNDLIVRDSTGQQSSFVIWDADPGFDQNPTFVFPEVPAVSTMLAVSAYTLQKFNSGMTGKEIPIENRCRPVANGCCNCSSGGGLWIDSTGQDRKFLIAHEMGHRLLSLYMGSYNNDVSYDLIPGNNTGTCDTTTSHSMWSMENESGAAMEGWAHFIAVATFNNRDGTNPGAAMRYWSGDGVDVDVEQGPTGGASNYYDDVCNVAIASKMGVELDWLRHWWDYYSNDTNVDPGFRPSVTRMMDELDAAPQWSANDAFDSMRSGVLAHSGQAQLDRWDQHGQWNGID